MLEAHHRRGDRDACHTRHRARHALTLHASLIVPPKSSSFSVKDRVIDFLKHNC